MTGAPIVLIEFLTFSDVLTISVF